MAGKKAQPVELSPKRKEVYTIVDNANQEGKSFWFKIGSAWVNRDGSLNVTLAAMPINGKLHIRDAEEREPRQSNNLPASPDNGDDDSIPF